MNKYYIFWKIKKPRFMPGRHGWSSQELAFRGKQKSFYVGKIHCCHLRKGVGGLIVSLLLTFLSLQPQPEVMAIKCRRLLHPHETHGFLHLKVEKVESRKNNFLLLLGICLKWMKVARSLAKTWCWETTNQPWSHFGKRSNFTDWEGEQYQAAKPALGLPAA